MAKKGVWVAQFIHYRRKWQERVNDFDGEKWWVKMSNAYYSQSPNKMQWWSNDSLVMHNEQIDQVSFRLESLMARLPDFVLRTQPIANGDFLLKPRKNTGYHLVSFVLISS